MKTLTAIATLAILALTMAPAAQAQTTNLTGKWTGTFTIEAPDGSMREQSIDMDLTHKGKELTGTAGPNAERQWTIAKGVVTANKVTFDVQSDGPVISFTLTLADGRLKGDAAAEQDGRKLSAKVDVGRVK